MLVFSDTVPPLDERNKLWMVEAQISPEMMKRKKKKKKRKKEVRPAKAEEEQDAAPAPTSYRRREFGPSAVPRLPKLPGHRFLVASLWEQQQREEENVLPGSFPEPRPSCPLPCPERYGNGGGGSGGYLPPPSGQRYSQGGSGFKLISNPLSLQDRQREELGRFRSPPPPWPQNGVFRHSGEVEPVGVGTGRTAVPEPRAQGRRTAVAPIHSRTNLMDAELMDLDSDF